MTVISNTIRGDHEFASDTVLTGVVGQSAVVKSSIHVLITGIVGKDLTIEPHARVEVNGTVGGSVANSGVLEVNGIVAKLIDTLPGGRTIIHPGAYVNGVKH